MSYDVSIGSYSGNYTSNLGSLFHKHIRRQDEPENTGLQCLNGLTGTQAICVLREAWDNIQNERRSFDEESDFCRKYDAPNGWGSLIGALVFLGEITAACGYYPHYKIHVDC